MSQAPHYEITKKIRKETGYSPSVLIREWVIENCANRWVTIEYVFDGFCHDTGYQVFRQQVTNALNRAVNKEFFGGEWQHHPNSQGTYRYVPKKLPPELVEARDKPIKGYMDHMNMVKRLDPATYGFEQDNYTSVPGGGLDYVETARKEVIETTIKVVDEMKDGSILLKIGDDYYKAKKLV